MINRDNEQVNVFDIERILGDLPLELIKENITTQIEDPLTYSSNYCTEVYEAFDEASQECGHIDDFKNDITEHRNLFTMFLLGELERKFDLGMDVESMSEHAIEELTRACYEFFVIGFRENVNNFLLNYIMSNKMSLSALFDDEYKRKDVMTMNMKKQLKSREDVLILSNLPDVINYILTQDHQNEDFLELCSEPGEYTAELIKSSNNAFTLAGNFVINILNEIKFAHNDVIDDFSANIKLAMLESIMSEDNENDNEMKFE